MQNNNVVEVADMRCFEKTDLGKLAQGAFSEQDAFGKLNFRTRSLVRTMFENLEKLKT